METFFVIEEVEKHQEHSGKNTKELKDILGNRTLDQGISHSSPYLLSHQSFIEDVFKLQFISLQLEGVC
jgi:hypothetical protein